MHGSRKHSAGNTDYLRRYRRASAVPVTLQVSPTAWEWVGQRQVRCCMRIAVSSVLLCALFWVSGHGYEGRFSSQTTCLRIPALVRNSCVIWASCFISLFFSFSIWKQGPQWYPLQKAFVNTDWVNISKSLAWRVAYIQAQIHIIIMRFEIY